MASKASIEHGRNVRNLIVSYVTNYFTNLGRGPTHLEIARAAGISQTRAQNLVEELIAAGRLIRTPGAQRTLRPPQRPIEAVS